VKRENVDAAAHLLYNVLTFNRLPVFVMRFAIFSDIHSNLEALEAVITDARERRCTHFVCLGDVVGYNVNPHECIERVRELDCPVVKGNHDEQTTLPASSERFNELAERAINWTREHLTEQDKEWLRSLPLQRLVHDFTIVHATLDTPGQWGYVFNNLDALANFTYQRTAVCFFGHTHVPMVFVRDEGVRHETGEHIRIEPGKKYFINAGSVGQPRDGNWRAAYRIYDVDNNLVELLRVKYDVATAQKKITKAGLPRLLAERLAMGR
jgi:predicted phosphodiesterase